MLLLQIMKSLELAPFGNSLLETNSSPDVMVIAETPGVIVRIEDNVVPRSSVVELNDVAELLEDLEAEYGIKYPGYMPVVAGKNRYSSRAYVVVQRIEGTSLTDAVDDANPEVLRQASTLFSRLTTYLEDQAKTNGEYLSDIFGERQYMYGHTKASPKNEIYLIDLGAHVAMSDSSLASSEGIARRAVDLFQDMMKIKGRTGQEFLALGRVVGLINSIDVGNEALKEIIELVNEAYATGVAVPDDLLSDLGDHF
jgi:hypothetical protein